MNASALPESCFKMCSTHIVFKTSSPPLQSTQVMSCALLPRDEGGMPSMIAESRRKGRDGNHRRLQVAELTFFIISSSSS